MDGIASKISSAQWKTANLIAKANLATGHSDNDLSAALDTLIAGYSGGEGVDMVSGTLEYTEDDQVFEVEHGLGKIPKCIIVFPDEDTDASSLNDIVFACLTYFGTGTAQDENGDELTGDDAVYSTISDIAYGFCVYRTATGMRNANMGEPVVTGVTAGGASFEKYTNLETAFTPDPGTHQFAPGTYRWAVIA